MAKYSKLTLRLWLLLFRASSERGITWHHTAAAISRLARVPAAVGYLPAWLPMPNNNCLPVKSISIVRLLSCVNFEFGFSDRSTSRCALC